MTFLLVLGTSMSIMFGRRLSLQLSELRRAGLLTKHLVHLRGLTLGHFYYAPILCWLLHLLLRVVIKGPCLLGLSSKMWLVI